jgi:hypothetical protein
MADMDEGPPRLDWKDEKRCALCDIEWGAYYSGDSTWSRSGKPEKRYLAGHLVCDLCFYKCARKDE